MTDPRLDDHLAGLEQELVELVERRTRAQVQGRDEDAAALVKEIDAVQAELVATAEAVATGSAESRPQFDVDTALTVADTPPSARRRAHRSHRTWLRRSPLKHA